MFVRKKKNKSGTTSIQVIDKSNGYRVVETIGSSKDPEVIKQLIAKAWRFINNRDGKQAKLFSFL